jgi:hypothetical protein
MIASVERILNQHMVILDTLSKIVDGYLEQSSYQYVDLPNLLAQCYIQKTRY